MERGLNRDQSSKIAKDFSINTLSRHFQGGIRKEMMTPPGDEKRLYDAPEDFLFMLIARDGDRYEHDYLFSQDQKAAIDYRNFDEIYFVNLKRIMSRVVRAFDLDEVF